MLRSKGEETRNEEILEWRAKLGSVALDSRDPTAGTDSDPAYLEDPGRRRSKRLTYVGG